MDVLEDMSEGQINLASEAARKTIANSIIAAIKTNEKGWFLDIGDLDGKTKFTKEELETQRYKEYWTCGICGKDTSGVDYDYIGSGTNHLGCELELESEDIDEQAYAQGRESSYDDMPEGLKRAKELSQEAIKEGIQKQAYMEMTADGLPEGGDTQAVLESHKLADEIVDRQEGKWIYESPDGGKTVFRRPFSDYEPENKEEIDWETKEPTGRKFTDYPFKVNRGPDRRRAEK
jgi:hypothetical protein